MHDQRSFLHNPQPCLPCFPFPSPSSPPPLRFPTESSAPLACSPPSSSISTSEPPPEQFAALVGTALPRTTESSRSSSFCLRPLPHDE
ncbi:uncharacterized protein SCHCODRAFT_02102318 [Schizophyllum commune H4-8]|uniref:uncharacterized protein n=1 Tax=Schizophyllum commune (strain H4-8 / FGSC 9210) TaxID=578458 RepID=UPI00215E08FD|nr:uncharacterized protein SCHCODRAFT_02102318 [Schizophyllum commune H4-8]KAI5886617.1 hypothetical protein SCHCODRAFT_02102318 [Schizophyllum commune H4-8]